MGSTIGKIANREQLKTLSSWQYRLFRGFLMSASLLFQCLL